MFPMIEAMQIIRKKRAYPKVKASNSEMQIE